MTKELKNTMFSNLLNYRWPGWIQITKNGGLVRSMSRKGCSPDNTFLYAFKDIELASSENSTYLARTVKDKEFDADKHEKITNKFGVIIFESDVDLSLKDAYLTYESRWLLEAMFKQYKSNEALKETRVQEDFTVIGYEFVNFISTLITSRIINHSRACGVLNSMTYGEVIEALNSVWRESDAKD